MPAIKFSASMDDTLLADARADAEAEGLTLSTWLADAAADRLRLRSLRELVTDWEAEHGAITTAELDAFEKKVHAARPDATNRQPRTKEASRGRRAAS